ncbi:hypothetical protein Daud_1394 [Candidatus Desulforudis audaxviator MP104C]|uniref:Uncharacterized protein n=1 Tax=Desulforudis audaxviator (strain MP104C) TaxID=477974 RepID=B1I499_DESAP|nr:hypothetical protein Daud_1394 [Candidatus Desulforudis audaxviator MP104C]
MPHFRRLTVWPSFSDRRPSRCRLRAPRNQAFNRYAVTIPLRQGVLGLTVRVRPVGTDFLFPFEVPLVTWAPEF